MSTNPGLDRATRLRVAADRIRSTAPSFSNEALTSADPESGERWDRGQVLAHVAEILPYWTHQAELVLEQGGGGAAFGRVKTDPDRIAAIERSRGEDTAELLARMDQGLRGVFALLARLDDQQLAEIGTHERLGEMTVAQIIDRFLVEHLEEHADQLAEGSKA
jgi:DinB family protein